ncbi:cytochrome P450 [Undibacterium flavidum]|uniref:Cytochrome P450 n=1 Tax=Undibacterium flavidum TaxID=2762297 RepID=A0ABR6Y8Y7_9BURK|nr:cytochrome P450 [Undibacterium flavidum]MBC3873088.1 cytochrome P450 [Undibacterium flavidum]
MSSIPVLTLPSHPDPYPAYQWHVSQDKIRFDEDAQCWIVAQFNVVQEVLASSQFVVRPLTAQVPPHIAGSSAGELFSLLIRMNEGEQHRLGKQVLQTSLNQLDLRQLDLLLLDSKIAEVIEDLSGRYDVNKADELNAWIRRLAVSVIAKLYGFSNSELDKICLWIDEFVQCFSPISTPTQLGAASKSAVSLMAAFQNLLSNADSDPDSFLYQLQAEAKVIGWDSSSALCANLIGLLTQSYEASAGLIGNTLIALHHDPVLYTEVKQEPTKLPQLISEVARLDSPVQNTRRFVKNELDMHGVALRTGDCILLLLAAANRDPAANYAPDELLINRRDRRMISFSHGRHTCPGQGLAVRIASAGLHHILKSLAPSSNHQADVFPFAHLYWTYRPSANGRLPVFYTHEKDMS